MTVSIDMCGGNSSVTINGVVYKGNNISINNDLVMVDGEVASEANLVGPVTVTVNGNVGSVKTVSGVIRVSGDAGEVKSTSGDIIVTGQIHGNARTVSGDIISRK